MSPSQNDNHLATPRLLNMNDLADAHRLPMDERGRLTQSILSELRSIEAPTGRDAAGIAHRGALIFRERLEGRSIKELAAAYVELRLLGAQTGVIDAIETTVGTPANDRWEGHRQDSQAQLKKAFREQMKRFHCPGCGDDEIDF